MPGSPTLASLTACTEVFYLVNGVSITYCSHTPLRNLSQGLHLVNGAPCSDMEQAPLVEFITSEK